MIPVVFKWYFFHDVNDRYTMRYYIQRYIKTFWNTEKINYKHQKTFNNDFLCSERIFHSFKNFLTTVFNLVDTSLFKSLQNSFIFSCICLFKSATQLAWSGFRSDNFDDTSISVGSLQLFNCRAIWSENQSLYRFWIKAFSALLAVKSNG